MFIAVKRSQHILGNVHAADPLNIPLKPAAVYRKGKYRPYIRLGLHYLLESIVKVDCLLGL